MLYTTTVSAQSFSPMDRLNTFINQLNPGVNFALEQPIQWTGGIISVNTTYNYFNNILTMRSQWNGSVLNIRLEQPILSYNQYKWDK